MIFTDKRSYALNKRKILQWLKNSEYTLYRLARALKMSKEELGYKIHRKKLLKRRQIVRLVYLLGVQTAFTVIWFPTIREKREVFEEVFVKPLKRGGGIR